LRFEIALNGVSAGNRDIGLKNIKKQVKGYQKLSLKLKNRGIFIRKQV
jgi:hypothetical protein